MNDEYAVVGSAVGIVAGEAAEIALSAAQYLICEVARLTERIEQLEQNSHWHWANEEKK